MCFEGELAPSFDMRCLTDGPSLPDGWGLGYYPAGEPSASVLKEPAPSRRSIRGELVKAWEHLESSLFVLHVRTATWGSNTDANTQPFVKSWGGRDWMIGHAGSLVSRLDEEPDPRFEPIGATDTERVFCVLLGRIAARGWRSLGDADPRELHGWLLELNTRGTLDLVLCDGKSLLAYGDRSKPGLHLAALLPPYAGLSFGDDDVQIDLTRRGSKQRKGCVISSEPLAGGGAPTALAWRPLAPGEMIVLRQGAVVGGALADEAGEADENGYAGPPRLSTMALTRAERRRSTRKPPARLSIVHRTSYRYAHPVERSTHLLRLFPTHDRLQTLLESNVTVSVEGRAHDFDDAFGNRSRRILLETPYRDLTITSHSRVEALDSDPLGFGGLDPTNGVVTSTNHVRLAVGCGYRDATPTSGTIYVGGGGETLEVDVRVEEELTTDR